MPVSSARAISLIRTPVASPSIERKAVVSSPGDALEQEADAVADRVMRMAQPTSIGAGSAQIQRKCAACADEDNGQIHAKRATVDTHSTLDPSPAVEAAARGGVPLSPDLRSYFEPRFAHDFSQVRVHADSEAAAAAHAVQARAYTLGRDIVFAGGEYAPATTQGKQLLAHELAHVVQQNTGVVARQPAQAGDPAQKGKAKPPARKPKCDTGCAQRWGQDTTCSKWGFEQGSHEHGEGKNWKSYACCNSWPWSVEDYARNQLGLNGAASCHATHQKETATVSYGDNEVEVLCSDTMPNDKFGETTGSPGACAGKIETEVIEISPKAMSDLSGQIKNALSVEVCYSGTKADLCLHNGPGKKSRPEVSHCLTRGCVPWEGTPTLAGTGWPGV
jgi:hypothetical protein